MSVKFVAEDQLSQVLLITWPNTYKTIAIHFDVVSGYETQYSMEIIDPEVFTIDEVLDIFKKITTSKTGWLRYHDVLLSLGGGEGKNQQT